MMPSSMTKIKNRVHHRNHALYDWWSLTHVTWASLLGWIMNPFVALAIMVLWEPLENFVLNPLLAKINIDFGYESLQNSLSDIVFDVVGVAIGAFILKALIDPPFYLF